MNQISNNAVLIYLPFHWQKENLKIELNWSIHFTDFQTNFYIQLYNNTKNKCFDSNNVAKVQHFTKLSSNHFCFIHFHELMVNIYPLFSLSFHYCSHKLLIIGNMCHWTNCDDPETVLTKCNMKICSLKIHHEICIQPKRLHEYYEYLN